MSSNQPESVASVTLPHHVEEESAANGGAEDGGAEDDAKQRRVEPGELVNNNRPMNYQRLTDDWQEPARFSLHHVEVNVGLHNGEDTTSRDGTSAHEDDLEIDELVDEDHQDPSSLVVTEQSVSEFFSYL